MESLEQTKEKIDKYYLPPQKTFECNPPRDLNSEANRSHIPVLGYSEKQFFPTKTPFLNEIVTHKTTHSLKRAFLYYQSKVTQKINLQIKRREFSFDFCDRLYDLFTKSGILLHHDALKNAKDLLLKAFLNGEKKKMSEYIKHRVGYSAVACYLVFSEYSPLISRTALIEKINNMYFNDHGYYVIKYDEYVRRALSEQEMFCFDNKHGYLFLKIYLRLFYNSSDKEILQFFINVQERKRFFEWCKTLFTLDISYIEKYLEKYNTISYEIRDHSGTNTLKIKGEFVEIPCNKMYAFAKAYCECYSRVIYTPRAFYRNSELLQDFLTIVKSILQFDMTKVESMLDSFNYKKVKPVLSLKDFNEIIPALKKYYKIDPLKVLRNYFSYTDFSLIDQKHGYKIAKYILHRYIKTSFVPGHVDITPNNLLVIVCISCQLLHLKVPSWAKMTHILKIIETIKTLFPVIDMSKWRSEKICLNPDKINETSSFFQNVYRSQQKYPENALFYPTQLKNYYTIFLLKPYKQKLCFHYVIWKKTKQKKVLKEVFLLPVSLFEKGLEFLFTTDRVYINDVFNQDLLKKSMTKHQFFVFKHLLRRITTYSLNSTYFSIDSLAKIKRYLHAEAKYSHIDFMEKKTLPGISRISSLKRYKANIYTKDVVFSELELVSIYNYISKYKTQQKNLSLNGIHPKKTETLIDLLLKLRLIRVDTNGQLVKYFKKDRFNEFFMDLIFNVLIT